MKELNETNLRARSSSEKKLKGIDSRALLIVFFGFILFAVSVDKFDIVGLIAFFSFPLIFIIGLGLSIRSILKKLLFVSPFLIMLGVFNPFLDTRAFGQIGTFTVNYGMVSFAVIALKGALSVVSIFILTMMLPIQKIGAALCALKVPQAFVTQILFLYRYIFVLVAETQSAQRARNLRSFDGRGRELKTTVKLLGTLFMRTLNRSERIHRSMVSRGFDGVITISDKEKFGFKDLLFIILFVLFFVFLRLGWYAEMWVFS